MRCVCCARCRRTLARVLARSRARSRAARSHDLRTPVHGMQVASQLLAARAGVAADPEATYLLHAVRASSCLMLATITNVLDLRSLEGAADAPQRAEQLRKREPVALLDLFADVLGVCRVACSKELLWANQPDAAALPEALEGNPERLRHILLNVAVVAATLAGAQPVRAELHCCDAAPAADGAVQVRAVFTALGRELSQAEHAAAFNPFERGGGGGAPGNDDSGAHTTGARLALLVSRSLARGMDGDLALSATAEGARFELRVRLCRPGAPGAPPAERPCAAASPAASTAKPLATAPPQLPPPPPLPAGAPPAVELTQRLFEFLVRHSDEVFHSGVVTDNGPTLVRHMRLLLRSACQACCV